MSVNSPRDSIPAHFVSLSYLTHDAPEPAVAAALHSAYCLQQAARSLLLAQASDWPSMIRNGTTVEYATRRLQDHLARFHYLEGEIKNGIISERRLQALETMDNIFPNLNCHIYAHSSADSIQTTSVNPTIHP